MADVTIYHNPRCSSSRTALGELRSRDLDLDVVEYLKTPLDRASLEQLLDVLDAPVGDLIRHDARFEELGLDSAGYTSKAEVVDLLVEHPELMQRPILVRDGKAVIARPAAEVVAAFVDQA